MEFVDYYEIMGLRPEASLEEIKRAYRKLARKYHPDVSEEADAETRFKALGEAYAVLKDPERRREYDELRELRARGGAWSRGAGGSSRASGTGTGAHEWRGGNWQGAEWDADAGAGFSDFFRDLFGEAAARGHAGGEPGVGPGGMSLKGEDMHGTLAVSLRDVHDGATLPLTLRVPHRGADGALDVRERTLQVRIPAGIESGRRIRLRGQGGPGINDGDAGDLYVEIRIEEDPLFALDGRDVTLVLPLSPWEAALGTTVAVPTLGGEVRLTVPPRSSGGRRLRLKGRGLAGTPPGDQFVVLRIELPQPDTDEQRALYERMKALWPEHDPRAGLRGEAA